jgi:hypothetical protein
MTPRAYIEQHGYRISSRYDFLSSTTNLIADSCVDEDGEEFLALKDRARQFDGEWIIYDPEDNSEGWLLVGNDLAYLIALTAERIDAPMPAATLGQVKAAIASNQPVA